MQESVHPSNSYVQNCESLLITLSQMTNFKLFQIERVYRRQFKFIENGRKFSKRVENTVGKGVTSNFTFSHSVFQRLVLETGKNTGMFGKGSVFVGTILSLINAPPLINAPGAFLISNHTTIYCKTKSCLKIFALSPL